MRFYWIRIKPNVKAEIGVRYLQVKKCQGLKAMTKQQREARNCPSLRVSRGHRPADILTSDTQAPEM